MKLLSLFHRATIVLSLTLASALAPLTADAQPLPPLPATPVAPPTGRVVETRPGLALVDFGGATSLFVGLRVAVRPPGLGGVLDRGDQARVVGVVDAIVPEGVIIRFGDSERVEVGDVVTPTSLSRTHSRIAPAAPNSVLRVAVLAGPSFRQRGFGLDVDLSYFAEHAYVFASSLPGALLRGESQSAYGFSGILGAGLHDRLFAVGLGGALFSDSYSTWSSGDVMHRSVGGGLALRVRVGSLDGLAFTSDVLFRVGGNRDYSATPRLEFGVQAPFGDRVIFGLHGGLWMGEGGYSDLHTVTRVRLRGQGGPGTLYGVLDVTVFWPRSCLSCSDGDFDYYESGAVPALQVGIESRIGVGGERSTR